MLWGTGIPKAESHVLVVDADAERAGRTSAVLTFCDCNPVVAPDPPRALSAYGERSDWTVAIIGEVADFEGWCRFLDALRAGAASPPLLLLGDRPGSVRERGLAGVLAWPLDEPIRSGQLSDYLRRASSRHATEVVLPEEGLDLKATIAQIEVDLISHALQRAGGVVARAAQTLRMRRTTLVEKLRKYGLDRATIAGLDGTHPKAH